MKRSKKITYVLQILYTFFVSSVISSFHLYPPIFVATSDGDRFRYSTAGTDRLRLPGTACGSVIDVCSRVCWVLGFRIVSFVSLPAPL